MYCVKCKSKTGTTNTEFLMSKNNRHMKRGTCVKCGKIKNQFVSKADAKKGGFIFTIPALLAAAGALGGLAGGASGIASAVNKKKSADKLLAETERHNKVMESKKGDGLFLKPFKGKGLHLTPYKS